MESTQTSSSPIPVDIDQVLYMKTDYDGDENQIQTISSEDDEFSSQRTNPNVVPKKSSLNKGFPREHTKHDGKGIDLVLPTRVGGLNFRPKHDGKGILPTRVGETNPAQFCQKVSKEEYNSNKHTAKELKKLSEQMTSTSFVERDYSDNEDNSSDDEELENLLLAKARSFGKNNNNKQSSSFAPQLGIGQNNLSDLYTVMVGQHELDVTRIIKLEKEKAKISSENDRNETKLHYLKMDYTNITVDKDKFQKKSEDTEKSLAISVKSGKDYRDKYINEQKRYFFIKNINIVLYFGMFFSIAFNIFFYKMLIMSNMPIILPS